MTLEHRGPRAEILGILNVVVLFRLIILMYFLYISIDPEMPKNLIYIPYAVQNSP